MWGCFNIQNNVIHHINTLKEKYHDHLNAEKASERKFNIHCSFFKKFQSRNRRKLFFSELKKVSINYS